MQVRAMFAALSLLADAYQAIADKAAAEALAAFEAEQRSATAEQEGARQSHTHDLYFARNAKHLLCLLYDYSTHCCRLAPMQTLPFPTKFRWRNAPGRHANLYHWCQLQARPSKVPAAA